MFVVPNHLVDQWGAEFLKLYPRARLLVAGKEHFATENRQQAMARIAKALTFAILSWRDDQTMQARGQFRGFEILRATPADRPAGYKSNAMRSSVRLRSTF